MSRLEEETARTAILRNRVSGLEEDLGAEEADRLEAKRAAIRNGLERDKLVAGLEAEIASCREIAADFRWHSEVRSARSASADRLQHLLDTYRGGDDGNQD